DHLVVIGHEKVVEQVETMLFAEAIRWKPGNNEQAVGGAAVGITLELEQKAGHEIDGATHLREFEEVHRHAVVVLDAVQANAALGSKAFGVGYCTLPLGGIKGDVSGHRLGNDHACASKVPVSAKHRGRFFWCIYTGRHWLAAGAEKKGGKCVGAIAQHRHA